MPNTKIKNINVLCKILDKERKKNKKIVFTNGCFDLIHLGHVTYLNDAKKFGDILVLGLNSDASVKRLKGSARPIFSQKDRAEILASFEFIDYIVIFSEDTPLNIIKKIKPNVLIKGGDYKINDIVGAPFVISMGGAVKTIPFVKDKSTSKMIKNI
jgi:rfaE bifunctional protein nucleotidyltransferase chain/domain